MKLLAPVRDLCGADVDQIETTLGRPYNAYLHASCSHKMKTYVSNLRVEGHALPEYHDISSTKLQETVRNSSGVDAGQMKTISKRKHNAITSAKRPR